MHSLLQILLYVVGFSVLGYLLAMLCTWVCLKVMENAAQSFWK